MKKTLNQNGFSLIEIMITLIISSVAALFFADYLSHQAQQTKQVEAKSSFNQIVGNVQQTTSQPASITNSEAACNAPDLNTCF